MGALVTDGEGLSWRAKEILAETGGAVQLRTGAEGESRKTACDDVRSYGEWWSGLSEEVNCKKCLEVIANAATGTE